MTEQQYLKRVESINNLYDRIHSRYVKQQYSKEQIVALQQERNQKLLELSRQYQKEKS